MGGGSTTVSVFHEGRIRHVASLMFAGGHVTNDIVHGLQVTQQDAERIKHRYGAAFEPIVSDDETFELPGTAGQGHRVASRRVLAHIIHMRLQEVLELALGEVSRAGYQQHLPAGVVLTGGGSQLPGIVELAREVFAMPVRVGKPGQGLAGLTDSVESPRFAVAAGLALYGSKQLRQGAAFGSGKRGSQAVEKWVRPVRQWFQDIF
jgi:cell division protein FtsA